MASDFPYVVDGAERIGAYFLANGIYPSQSFFVKAFLDPIVPEENYFMKRQESVRKDVEKAFGVLQSRFAIVVHAATKHKLGCLIST